MDVRVQKEAFDISAEMDRLTAGRGDIGALVSFTGIVRGEPGDVLELEHYAGMTEKLLTEITAEARKRWQLSAGTVIHRYGRLQTGDAIVLVIMASAHRSDAFQAAEFVMDWLKTRAPFWKKEISGGTTRWVAARGSDDAAAARWD